MRPSAAPVRRGVPALLARVVPAFGATDEGRALAYHLTDVMAALLRLAAVPRG